MMFNAVLDALLQGGEWQSAGVVACGRRWQRQLPARAAGQRLEAPTTATARGGGNASRLDGGRGSRQALLPQGPPDRARCAPTGTRSRRPTCCRQLIRPAFIRVVRRNTNVQVGALGQASRGAAARRVQRRRHPAFRGGQRGGQAWLQACVHVCRHSVQTCTHASIEDCQCRGEARPTTCTNATGAQAHQLAGRQAGPPLK